MSSKIQTLFLLLVLTISSSFTVKASSSDDAGIAIYWGQNNGDGTLSSTCDTGNFEIVILAFLNVFGEGRPPSWNFAGHCGDWSPCTKLEPEIKHCQQKGIKVFLSIGGAAGTYSLGSPNDAKDVSDYLYTNFLSGQFGPLGSVTLDGIDFDIEGGTNLYWDDLAINLDNLRQQNRYFYLAAAPQCVIPDRYLDKAIKTGLFDYIFVQFYNNPPCQYDIINSDATKLLKSWNDWTSLVLPNNTVFMGLPAAPEAAPSGGYIPPDDLITKVLPFIKPTSNYGGVMLWDRNHDVGNNYSNQIKDYVKKSALRFVTQVSEAIVGSISAALNALLLN
ncbi:acidic endochitinase-like [Vicia villosa]|uniref:acidic endochitinase-like n=1 Tax=Vicia villosa TaxID=3911 RepID=UPI00273B3DB2|nr:acidic endochitinase-like [Vicia villosa]